MRPSGRKNDQTRKITIETGILYNNKSSCVVKFGNTHVLCSATIDNFLPRFLKGSNSGWLTAEYSMLPASTNTRNSRDTMKGKPNGRTVEIQRLISRSLRAALDLKRLGERQIIIDCDVINADGGTRTAAITGGYVALYLAVNELVKNKIIKTNPLIHQVAAISCGIFKDSSIIDLDYEEDSQAAVDANFIFAGDGKIVEIQGCGEQATFSAEEFTDMLNLAQNSMQGIFAIQNQALLANKK